MSDIAACDNASHNEKALLMLNEYCLMEISEYLAMRDFVSLSKTCTLLRDLCNRVCTKKFKNIQVEVLPVKNGHNVLTEDEFSDNLSMIGSYISTVEIEGGNDVIVKTIRDNCKNLKGIGLVYCKEPLQLHHFRHLKELKLSWVRICMDDLRKCFANNRIESLVYESCILVTDTSRVDFGFNGLFKLLVKLPDLKSLRIYASDHSLGDSLHQSRVFQFILFDGLTKFSFSSLNNCNELLTVLANKMKSLLELEFNSDGNADTFNLIKLFQNLEILTMESSKYIEDTWFSNAPEFPPKLKHIHLPGIKISQKCIVSLVKNLKFLEKFHIGQYGRIFSDNDKCKFLCQNLNL